MQVTKDILYTSHFGVGAKLMKRDGAILDYDEQKFLEKSPLTVVSISTTKYLYPHLFLYLIENADGERKHFSWSPLVLLNDTNAHISVVKTQKLVSKFNVGDNVLQETYKSGSSFQKVYIPCKVVDIKCAEDNDSKTFSFKYLIEYTKKPLLDERKLVGEHQLCANIPD